MLPRDSRSRFRSMVAFRNRAVHLYGDIDSAQIFAILEEDLPDFELFVRAISERYLKPGTGDS